VNIKPIAYILALAILNALTELRPSLSQCRLGYFFRVRTDTQSCQRVSAKLKMHQSSTGA